MLKRYSLVVALIYIFEAICASSDDNLDQLLTSTTIFFEKLQRDYDSQTLNSELYKLIDEQVNGYLDKVKKSTILSRGRRQLDLDKDVGILNGFERLPGLDLPDAIDVTFFDYQSGVKPRWYVAALNSSGIFLFEYQRQIFRHVGSYHVENGTRIISHSSEAATLLVVQRSSNGDALVIRMSQENARVIYLHKVQTVDTPNAIHATVWRGMRKIYLAVSSRDTTNVFTWLGEHFDRIQKLNIGARRLVPFKTAGGTMHLVAVDESRTSILKFLLRSREFVVVQRLLGSKDATTFNLERSHNGEYLIALAGKRSTIVYKQTRHRFVPFQELLSSADEIRSLRNNGAAILLFLVKNNEMIIYQYDGWKFTESAGVPDFGVTDVRSIALWDDEILALRTADSREPDISSIEPPIDEKITPNSNNASSNLKNSNDESSNFKLERIGNVPPNEANFSGKEFFPTTYKWTFLKTMWKRKETWSSLRERTKIWCEDSLEKTLRVPADVPRFEGPLRIERGHVRSLRARRVNGQSVEKFVKLAERLDEIISETKEQEKASRRYISTVNPTLKNLRTGNALIKCATSCRVEKTTTGVKEEFLEGLRRIDDVNQNLNFLNVRVSLAKNLPCPFPAPKFKHVTIDGFFNGISFTEFANDVLKITGDQELSGTHAFFELRVSNAKIPLDVASNFTRQEITANHVEVKELNVTSGGFLLPLNSDDNGNSVMSGTLVLSDVRMRGLVHVEGKIDGPGSRVLSPMIDITEPLELTGNFSMRNVTIVENLEARDFTRSNGRSFNEVISRALPLNSEHVPVRFEFRNDRVSWNNMTLRNFPYKWLTKKYSGDVVITGHKNASKTIVALEKFAYENLPIPRLPMRLCSVAAISDDIWESNLIIDQGSAKSVKATSVFNDSELSKVYLDSAISLDEVPWELKNLTGRIIVKEANIVEVTGMDYQGYKISMARWIEPGRLRGPVQLKNLKVNNLITADSLIIPLPLEVGNVDSRANIYIGTLNTIDFEDFIKNSVNTEDNLSLTNVTFAGGLVAKEIFASKTSFNLQENLSSGYMGSKEILGTFEAEEIIVPNFLHLPSYDTRVINIVANGNVQFTNVPKITNINNKNLDMLYNEIWLTDRPNKIYAEFVEFKNVTFESDLTILKSLDTPNLGPWTDLENRLLSKTRSQVIKVEVSFDYVGAPGVVASPKSHLRSNVSYLCDLESNSLKNNETQVITNDWKFEELTVTGNFDLRGRVNGLNLSTDVVRNDVRRNIVTGRKIVNDLTARNIDGLNFDKFAGNSLRKNNGNERIVVKGWKTFKTVEMTKDIRLEGSTMGRRIENSLLKRSSGQNLRGTKVFQGSVTSPAIVTDGLVNDISLRYFVENQFKKRAPLQIIKTPIILANNVTIFGNVTIEGLYQGVELTSFKRINNDLRSTMAARIFELLNFAEGIEIAFDNRATYWNNLELLEDNSTPLIPDPEKNEKLYFDGLGQCEITELSLHCDEGKVFDPLPISSIGSRVLQAEVIDLSGTRLVVSVTSDPDGGVFIFRLNPDEKRFYIKIAELYVPGIIEGSITTTMNSLWISLRLRDHVMILRYELWSNFEEWILPGNEASLMSSTPTNELLIFRSDGVWKLGGLAGPRRIFRATLDGKIDTFTFGSDYYVQLTDKNVTTLFKTRYVGN